MKKYIKFVLIVLIGMVLLPLTTYAEEENYYVIDLPEYGNNTFFEDNSIESYSFMFLVEKGRISRECNDIENGTKNKCEFFVSDGNIKLYEGTYVYDDDTIVDEKIFLENFTGHDPLTYTFTEEDKNNLPLSFSEYEGIKIIFSENVIENKVYISKVSLKEKTDTAFINSNAEINDLNINVDVKFGSVNDYVLYKVKVVNSTNVDYLINDETRYGNDDKYIKYEFSFDDDNTLLAGTSKVMYIKITYDKEVPAEILEERNYVETKILEVELKTETGDLIVNPETNDSILTKVSVLAVSVVLIIVSIKIKKVGKMLIVIAVALVIIPTAANALQKLNITINSKIEITNNKILCYENDGTYEYFEYKDGMTWKDFYEENSEVMFSTPNVFKYNEYDECPTMLLKSSSSATNNQQSDMSDREISCDGWQDVEITDKIMDYTVGCYIYAAYAE